MGTPANRMITVSRSSGSGLLPTTTDHRCYQGLVEKYLQMTGNPLLISDPQGISHERVGRLSEEVPNQDVRKMENFDTTSKKIRNLEEIPSDFDKQIWGNKEAIAKDRVMRELVREFIDTILDTANLCNGLSKCLRMEKTEHVIIKKLLRKVETGSPPLGEAQLIKVKEKLSDFVKNAQDPFEDLQQQYKSLLERYEQLRKSLEVKTKELRRKRKKIRVWKTVSGALMAALSAAAAISCVVVVVVAPPASVVVGMALDLYGASTWFLGDMIVSSRSRGKEKNLGEAEQLAEIVRIHTTTNELDLKGIKTSLNGLDSFRGPIVKYVNDYLENHDILDLADIAMPIRELEEQFLQRLDGLVKQVDGCREQLTQQFEDLKKPLL